MDACWSERLIGPNVQDKVSQLKGVNTATLHRVGVFFSSILHNGLDGACKRVGLNQVCEKPGINRMLAD